MPPDDLKFPEAALVCAVMSANSDDLERAVEALVDRFGAVRARSSTYDFDYSSYYEAEMGSGLIKQLLWLDCSLAPEGLADIKHQTIEMERQLGVTVDGSLRRRANIDPGIVTIESLVLVSTKYSGHRICIATGLYAETTLLFHKAGCRRLEWTYPDYCSEQVQEFLLEIRKHLLDSRQDT